MAFLTFAEAKVWSAPPFVPSNHMAHLFSNLNNEKNEITKPVQT